MGIRFILTKEKLFIMNEYLLRLALVVNTSHSKFIDNLTNIIVYVVYYYNSKEKQTRLSDLPDLIEEMSGLEFTEKEINEVLEKQTTYFCKINNDIIILTDKGNKKINFQRDKAFEDILNKYVKKFNIGREPKEIKSLIYTFLYNSIQNNIETLLNVIKGTENCQELFQLEKLSNIDRKIINDFIDWEDDEKNNLLYEIVSFAVDYCRLTVRKDRKNFATLLQGKTFYLDTNIIFRMMGLNNEKRQKTTLRFINKCKESKIKLRITSYTKKETLESIRYHVGEVKRIMRGYKGKGLALNKLYDNSGYEDGFLIKYLEWIGENGINEHYEEFYKKLQKQFYEILNDIKVEETYDIQVKNELLEDYMVWKEQRITKENAGYDVKNLLFVNKKRKCKSDTIGWNVGEYLISADHKLIKWSSIKFSAENPIVVLPSVWYSIILKLQGRAKDDIKAFIEFIKIRYIQDKPTENIQYLINSVCEKTSNGALQDMLFEEIADNNQQINELSFNDNYTIEKIVDKVYDDVLENTKNEGYISGKNVGEKSGYKQGISLGEKIGRIKAEQDHLKSIISTNALKIRERNILITLFTISIIIIIEILFFYKCPIKLIKNLDLYIKFILVILPSGIVGKILMEIFPLEIEKIKGIESEKMQEKIDELDRELKIYQG